MVILFSKRTLTALLFLCSSFFSVVFSQKSICCIETVQTFDFFKEKIKELNGNDLVVFDIDRVLIMPEDVFLDRRCVNEEIATLNAKGEGTGDIFFSNFLLKRKNKLVSPEVVEVIHDLQKRGIKTIALTAWSHGKYGVIEKIEDWRINELKIFDIDFSSSFPGFEEIELDYSVERWRGEGEKAYLKKGIVFGQPKGEVLRQFLTTVKFLPKRIIFIDDVRTHLDSVAKISQDAGIDFYGFEFVAANEK